jgi:hypothetical protein
MRRSSHFALLLTTLFFGCSRDQAEVETTDSVGQELIVGAPDVAPKVILASDAYKSCGELQKYYDPYYNAAVGPTWVELKVPWSAATSGKYYAGAMEVAISSNTGKTFTWASNQGISAVIVKTSSSGANLYPYGAEVWKDEYLAAPYSKYISNVSFCYVEKAAAAGVKFEDLDGDGYRDAGEPGLADWTIFVDYNNNGVLDAYEPSAMTGADGSYKIEGIKPGTWKVLEVQQAGWTCTYPPGCAYEKTFYAWQTIYNLDFGNVEDSTKSGMKFEDLDADGYKDEGEPGLEGWTIFVDYDDDGVLDADEPSDETDADGNYEITGIKPGTFKVREVLQEGWYCSYPYPCYYEETFTSGSNFYGNDFGNFQKGSKSGTKYQPDPYTYQCNKPVEGFKISIFVDKNGNYELDSYDVLLEYVATDAYGNYLFDDLMPGNYIVCEENRADWEEVSPVNMICAANSAYEPGGYAFTIESGEAETDNDFCNAPVVVNPDEDNNQGCTPGYWKNHTESWPPTGFATTDTLEDVFSVPDSLLLDNTTLLQALQGGGGPGVAGAAKILFRAAVAALLNSAPNSGVAYPLDTDDVISAVNAALATTPLNRQTMLDLATQLDNLNNGIGGCPLN